MKTKSLILFSILLLCTACNKQEFDLEKINTDTTIYDDDKDQWGAITSQCNGMLRFKDSVVSNKYKEFTWFDENKIKGMTISQVDTFLSKRHKRLGFMIDVSYLGTITGVSFYYSIQDSLYNVALICIKPGYRKNSAFKLAREHVVENMMPSFKYKNYELIKDITEFSIYQFQTAWFIDVFIIDSWEKK